MADLDIYYKGNKIFTADDDVRENLNTAGMYCEEDIIVDYTKHPLPNLNNPASASDITLGKEVIDGQGQKITGTRPYYLLRDSRATSVSWANATISGSPAVLESDYFVSLGQAFNTATFPQNGELSIRAPHVTNLQQMLNNVSNLKTLHLDIDWSIITTASNAIRAGATATLETIDADIDFSNLTTVTLLDYFVGAQSALVNIRFVPNTISVLSTSTFAGCLSLSDNSLISIANGLKDGVTGQTLTLHATPKARTLEIMGTVSQVTEDGVTYNFFTADEQGTTSLNSFITQTKGWTLA